MSSERQMKKITIETLESAEKKVSRSNLRRVLTMMIVLVLMSGGGYAAYRIVTGDVVASRFTVNRMNCPACVITVKEATLKVPGVVETDVSLAAQDVTVKFRERQASTDQIKEAISKAGYPVKLDGMYKPAGQGISEKVVARVNGRSLFLKDFATPFQVASKDGKDALDASVFFSVVGKEILLQAADAKTVVVQPAEVEAEIQKILADRGISKEELGNWVTARYGSQEKFYQVLGQRLGIRRLIEDHVLDGISSPDEKPRKVMEWAGTLFKDADVKILDQDFRTKIQSTGGQDDWKTFWPKMIAGETDLKSLLLQ